MGLKDGFGLNGGGTGGGGGNVSAPNGQVVYGSGTGVTSSANLTYVHDVLEATTMHATGVEAHLIQLIDDLSGSGCTFPWAGTSGITYDWPSTTEQGVLANNGTGTLTWQTADEFLTTLPEFASIAAAQGAGYSGKYVTLTGVTVGILTLNLVVKVP